VNLNYDKIKRRVEEGGNHWTSYSDLFLVLSVVFLLLFTVANIRSGTITMAQQTQLAQAKHEADDLKQQIKAYDVLKEDYVKNGASQDEIQAYHDLMDHMDLLASDAKKERDDLNAQAKAADEKAKNLNHYQAMVKNIISANLVASGKMKKRDLMLDEKDKDLDNLESTVQTQENAIYQNNATITQIQDNLKKQIEETRYAYRSKKNGQAKMEAAIKKLEETSQAKIDALQSKNSQTSTALDQTRSQLEQKNREAEKLMTSLTDKEAQYQTSIADMNQKHAADMARSKAAFEQSMNELKLGADARLDQERQFAAAEAKKNADFQAALDNAGKELERTRGSIKDVEGKYQASMASLQKADARLQQERELEAGQQAALNNAGKELARTRGDMKNMEGQYQASVASLQKNNQGLSSDLAAAQAKLNAQKELASQISKNFAAAGIDAAVDGKTGDVIINFKNEYFDTGRSDLKNGMKSILEKTFPVYAKSLMENPKIAKKIGSVEIVGFASPTYKGKSVDPSSLSTESREAVNYNMDLSYQRAKSIFEHVFDTNKMQFADQQKLLPLVKVSGRSYLATDRLPGRSTATTDGQDYCSVFDCKKSQRVIIKFNLKEE
jgi:outer membrane protein OmpA-like peptidoglycan-associated protein